MPVKKPLGKEFTRIVAKLLPLAVYGPISLPCRHLQGAYSIYLCLGLRGQNKKMHFAMQNLNDRFMGGRSLVGKGALCV